VLMGELRARGSVEWEGKAIRKWSVRELARRVAYLPQSPAFDAGDRVVDVLRLGRAPYVGAFGRESAADVEVVEAVARRLELEDVLRRTMDRLSGGQRQRVFIGRCLVQQPKAMLLDEPDAHLDVAHRAGLCKLLRGLATEQGIAVLAAVHDLNVAGAFAEKCLLLDGGRVAASGITAEVLNAKTLEAVFRTPIRRLESGSGRALVVAEMD
jgi:iron complex transport system ATP-binding protein